MTLDRPKVQRSVSRRDALKALAAVGGAAALSTVPNNWKKPLVEVGSLPAFAQLSQTVQLVDTDCAAGESGPGTFDLGVGVDYIGAVGGVCKMYVELNWRSGTSPVTDSFYETYSVGEHPDESGSFSDLFSGLTMRASLVQVCIVLYDCSSGFSNKMCRVISIARG